MNHTFREYIERATASPSAAHAVQISMRVPNTSAKTVEWTDDDGPAWCYEHLRKIVLDTNILVVEMTNNGCNNVRCQDMTTNGKRHLCEYHDIPANCSAPMHCFHSLDACESLLCVPTESLESFKFVMTKVYMILAHAWFSHPFSFIIVETQISLFKRVMAVNAAFDLIPDSMLSIPILNNCAQNRELLVKPVTVDYYSALQANEAWVALARCRPPQTRHLRAMSPRRVSNNANIATAVNVTVDSAPYKECLVNSIVEYCHQNQQASGARAFTLDRPHIEP
ncbi:hypothetical protein CANCADRAFT_45281 [Tortispora caseinolytica NRRL Y-17796]|uniref:Uncharacterized protein n=1 Tax=Tortispora caseinolytica NRRL Y-17796 TaxID=767744 RepID=A0A1E4TAV8_9ASCO|nr:hypothetical protein CANCADRAFT_45281 [Tortispora caseinolytica NRRL Y-17796]